MFFEITTRAFRGKKLKQKNVQTQRLQLTGQNTKDIRKLDYQRLTIKKCMYQLKTTTYQIIRFNRKKFLQNIRSSETF